MSTSVEAPRFHDPYYQLLAPAGRDAFHRLIVEENLFVSPESYVNDEAKKALRRTAVAMVESLCSNSIDALVPYTAMSYFDRYLSRKGARIPNVARRKEKLFVIGCVTLAWKHRNKRFTHETYMEEKGLFEDYEMQHVLEMELQICKALEWRLLTLTPFSFVEFYIPFLRCPPNQLPPRRLVRDLIIRSQCDIAFTEIVPSVLAVCAVIIVSAEMLPEQHDFFELMITTDVEPLRLQRNMVLKCLQLLRPFYRNPPICKPRDISLNPPTFIRPNPIATPGREQHKPAADEEAAFVDENHDDLDVLMDFELGWDEWLTECEMRDGQVPRACFSRPNLTRCMIKIGTSCEAFKDTIEGGRCNIL